MTVFTSLCASWWHSFTKGIVTSSVTANAKFSEHPLLSLCFAVCFCLSYFLDHSIKMIVVVVLVLWIHSWWTTKIQSQAAVPPISTFVTTQWHQQNWKMILLWTWYLPVKLISEPEIWEVGNINAPSSLLGKVLQSVGCCSKRSWQLCSWRFVSHELCMWL